MMRKILRSFPFPALWLALLFALPLVGQAADSAPDPAAIKTLAEALVAAPDDAARDNLLAAAPSALADSQELRRVYCKTYGPIIYAGDYARARTLVQYVHSLAEKHADNVGVAMSEWSLANIEGSCGDNHAALARFEKCAQLFEAAGEKMRLGGVLGGAAIVHLQLGEFRQALDCARRSEVLYRELNNREGILTAMNTQGNIFHDQGMYDRAEAIFQQAAPIIGDDEAWLIYLYHNLANIYSARGEIPRACELLEKSLALAEKEADKPRTAENLEEIAHLRRQAGQSDDAEKLYRRSLKIAEDIGDKRQITSNETALGELQWEVSRKRAGENGVAAVPTAEMLAAAERSRAVARSTGEPAYIWRSDTLLGNLRRAAGDDSQARLAYEEAIAAIEDARGHLIGNDTSTSGFFQDKLEPYEGMVALLAHGNRPLDALAMAERAKARSLLDILASASVNSGAAIMTDAESSRMTHLAEEVASLNRQIAAAKSANPPVDNATMRAMEETLARARSARDAGEEELFAAHPGLRDRQGPRTSGLDAAGLQGLLGGGATALLEYTVTAEHLYVFLITPDVESGKPPQVQQFTLPLGRETLAKRVAAFRQALADRSLGWQRDARLLGGELLAPVRDACAKVQRLVIVPDGPLWELPFQALAANGAEKDKPLRTVWEVWNVSFAPSLTFLAQDRLLAASGSTPGKAPRLLACGNPALGDALAGKVATAGAGSALMSDEFVPLPEAERQVRLIASLYGEDRSRTLIGKESDEDTFKRIADDFDIIHLATHGTFNDQAPMYSRLLMSQVNLAPDEDGLLEAWEWMPLKLHARLAILSACETGRGKIGAGEGVLGTSWALFGAGCPAVVVSQWKVDSASNTEMMIGFHRRLLAGEEPSEALRGAGLELARDPKYRHPFYWAPFVFLGASQPVAVPVARR